ncbi:FHA domain-containing protein, partial [uncultured Actinomyces sp.]|uniref:FHA domain-containing protein n=1 Tax=uncultured Actinomyces sp. TaxID=249061 RepID=UPI002670EA38
MSTAGNEHEAIVEESAVVDYCGEIYPIRADQEFLIGREADLCIDDNPFLHRRLVRISCHDGMWWLDNVGSRIAVTVADESGSMQARVGPGARIPLVFDSVVVVFAAGPTTYEFSVTVKGTTFRSYSAPAVDSGDVTVGEARFTPSQYLLILALCEPWLMQAGSGPTDIPPN